MIAVDTNVIVRLIVGDDESQAQAALRLAEREAFYVSFSVLVETEWVLRSRYGFDRAQTSGALLDLTRLVRIRFEDDADVRWAIDRFARGGELADYLHLAAARTIGRFATFEKRLKTRAGTDTPTPIETLI